MVNKVRNYSLENSGNQALIIFLTRVMPTGRTVAGRDLSKSTPQSRISVEWGRIVAGGWLGKIMSILVAATALLPMMANAQTTAYADGQGAPNQIMLQVQVQASVGGRCGFAASALPSGSFDQPDFDVTGFTHDFPFALECSGPSRVAVVSSHGGLMTAGTAPAGYATRAPYDVALHLVGETESADARCPAATLVSDGACPFRGPATTAQGLRLAAASIGRSGAFLRVSAPAYAATDTLVAGRYTDTLTITVSVAP